MKHGSVCCAGDSQPHGEGHRDLRGGAGGHRHHAESGVAHQRQEEEARARCEAAGTSAHTEVHLSQRVGRTSSGGDSSRLDFAVRML